MNTPTYTPGPWKADSQGRGVTRLVAVPTGEWVAMLGMSHLLNPANVSLIEAAPLMFAFLAAFLDTPPGNRHNVDLELMAEEIFAAAKGGVS